MKNREKFKEVFGVEVRWANVLTPQIEALSSITLKGVSCAGEWLESEYKEQPANVIPIPSMEQRFVVNGINNDKIELVSKYDVRKLNRLLDAKDKMWLVKIKQAREKIDNLDRYFDNDLYSDNEDSMFKCNEVLEILDKLISDGNNISNS